ncbi:aminotransferase class I/II-fold pyridoxal phosphate-dependent enzyme [Microbacterium awajiense]|uniref:cysteine-S-conjugate beta-lyase n=1 Tax=Microbacterium awajiense TaxID=415214 RepID=A0ABP7A355_9MICO
MSVTPLEALPIDELRTRTSVKWRQYPEDVLPLFVAETDFPLAPRIREKVIHAIERGDTGYSTNDPGVAGAYAAFAQRRFGWELDPGRVRTTGDVIMGVVELLRRLTEPGDRVIVTPPVYPPFFAAIAEAGAVAERVPLVDTGEGWELDLAGIEAALAQGARAVLLCNPHNPTGTVHSRESLAALADLAAGFGAAVVSDEIHSALTQPDVAFTPFLDASAAAARVGYAVTSASKAFNLAGLKCAFMITAGDDTAALVRGLPDEVQWRTSHIGAIAGVAAFHPDSDAWLDAELAALDENRRLLASELARHLPKAGYRVPDAGFLGWVDLTAYGWGDDPAATILRRARVALHHGPMFGDEGRGHVRINFGCAPAVLRQAVERIGALVS